MSLSVKTSLLEHLEGVTDPRIARTRRHKLLDILALSICAMPGGAGHWSEIAEFGHAKREWFARFLELPGGIPYPFAQVFARLDPAELEPGIVGWLGWLGPLAARIEPGEVMAIDGKSVRGSGSQERSALHIVSAWASAQSLLFAQVRTEEKSSEITAIPALLKLLSIAGGIVTFVLPNPRQHWGNGQKKSQPIRVGILGIGGGMVPRIKRLLKVRNRSAAGCCEPLRTRSKGLLGRPAAVDDQAGFSL